MPDAAFSRHTPGGSQVDPAPRRMQLEPPAVQTLAQLQLGMPTSISLDASMNRLYGAHHLAFSGCLSLPGLLLSSGSRLEARSNQIGHI